MTGQRRIDLTLGLASCRLFLNGGRRTASFDASNATDAVTEAVHACVALVRGRRDTGFVWRAEPDGVFVDIHVRDRLTNLIVQDMRNPEWPFDTWFPEHGDVLFRLSMRTPEFIRTFAEAVASLPAQAATGRVRPLWGLPLPEDEIAEVGRWLDRQDGSGEGPS
jgi:hypothetical protein